MSISEANRLRLTKTLSLIFSGALFFLGVETGYYLQTNAHPPGLVMEVQEHPPEEAAPAPDSTTAASDQPGDCAYVGSKNSNLYHLPTCAAAQRIKPENRLCFASAEEAAQKGYKPGCLK